jgi:hypothetical protein
MNLPTRFLASVSDSRQLLIGAAHLVVGVAHDPFLCQVAVIENHDSVVAQRFLTLPP